MDTVDLPADMDPEEAARLRILGETAKIPWQELQRFFAQGVVLLVKPPQDLVETALQVSLDNSEAVTLWMEQGRVCGISDEQASEWLEARALMWAVVVRPWVLVQPILADKAAQDLP